MKYESDELVREFKKYGRLFQLRWRFCGKSNCSKCPHGPYWFELQQRKDGGFKSWYKGKNLPEIKRSWGKKELSAD